MLSTTTSQATMEFSNLQQLATTAGISAIRLISAHNISSLEHVISELYNEQQQWIIVTNIQLLQHPELALNRLVEVV